MSAPVPIACTVHTVVQQLYQKFSSPLSSRFQSKHPHVIYEYTDKSPQGCAVSTANFGKLGGRRRKRSEEGEEEDALPPLGGILDDFLPGRVMRLAEEVEEFESKPSRKKRDVRTVQKFIELALVLDKAMVRE